MQIGFDDELAGGDLDWTPAGWTALGASRPRKGRTPTSVPTGARIDGSRHERDTGARSHSASGRARTVAAMPKKYRDARVVVARKDSATVPVGTLGSIRPASGLEHLR
jgi:hypothetical protein